MADTETMNNIQRLAVFSQGDSDLTEYISKYADISNTELNLEFWMWFWLGVVLGCTL